MNKPEPTYNYSFGRLTTDHMLTMDYNANDGWGKPKIGEYGPLSIETTATSLHYGISCFEGISIVKNSRTGIP